MIQQSRPEEKKRGQQRITTEIDDGADQGGRKKSDARGGGAAACSVRRASVVLADDYLGGAHPGEREEDRDDQLPRLVRATRVHLPLPLAAVPEALEEGAREVVPGEAAEALIIFLELRVGHVGGAAHAGDEVSLALPGFAFFFSPLTHPLMHFVGLRYTSEHFAIKWRS